MDANLEIVDTVEKISKERGVPMAMVATAWVLSRGCSPILGLSSEKRVEEGIRALDLILTDEEIKLLEGGYRPRRVEGM